MKNPYEIVREFEETIAEWAGAPYAVAVESCTAALFLSCRYLKVREVWLPKHTYPGVPNAVLHAGGRVHFHNHSWDGIYQLQPYDIWDGALRFRPGMYAGGFHCLSFHIKKHLPIGRGGMVLTFSRVAVDWLKRARFDGRGEVPLLEDNFTMRGWNMYMTPEQAARGLQLFSLIRNNPPEDLSVEAQGYPDLSRFPVFSNQEE